MYGDTTAPGMKSVAWITLIAMSMPAFVLLMVIAVNLSN
jgi:hypothetical protein